MVIAGVGKALAEYSLFLLVLRCESCYNSIDTTDSHLRFCEPAMRVLRGPGDAVNYVESYKEKNIWPSRTIAQKQ